MREISTDIEINASANRVWQALIDFAHYPQWNPFILKLEGDPVIGARLFALIQPPGLKAMSFRPIVRQLEAGRELRWLGHFLLPGLFDGEHSFLIESLDEHRTLFRQSEQFRGILVPLLWGKMADPIRRGFQSMNEALKRRVEAG